MEGSCGRIPDSSKISSTVAGLVLTTTSASDGVGIAASAGGASGAVTTGRAGRPGIDVRITPSGGRWSL